MADEALDALLARALAEPLKRRLRLLDALAASTVWEADGGLRFHPHSTQEYRRARKATVADARLREWVRECSPSDVLFDIGANTGVVALDAARVHDGRVPVVAFEPAADSFAALVRNIAANGSGAVVTPLQVALFDRNGVLPFYRASVGAGSSLHAVGEPVDFARRAFAPAAVEQVPACRLDDLVRWFGLPRPTRIKIDVDGAEARVLAGAEGVLSSGPCEVYLELTEASAGDPYAAGVVSFLERLGYVQVRTVDHGRPGTYPRVFDTLFARRG